MKIGDIETHRPDWAELEERVKTDKRTHKQVKGVVVYIHPKRRFYAVRYTFGGRLFLECYPCYGS